MDGGYNTSLSYSYHVKEREKERERDVHWHLGRDWLANQKPEAQSWGEMHIRLKHKSQKQSRKISILNSIIGR